VDEELAIRGRSTEFFLWAALALRCGRAVGVASSLAALTVIAQWLSGGTIISVLGRLVTELLSGEASTRLVVVINDRDVGLDVSLQQPGQELSAAIGFVGS
jgi:hypothetical protein